jgi:CheY-like chemotaxis protein
VPWSTTTPTCAATSPVCSPPDSVVTAADGAAALDLIQRNKPDLVLSDVMMPKLDGFGLLKAIRSRPELRTIPVILLSARAGEDSRIEGLDAGRMISW